jgi:signal peptidase I
MNSETLRARARRWWRKEILPSAILVLVMLSVRSSLADWSDVPTGSMKPTILEGDRVFVNKLAYDFKVPFTTWKIAGWSHPSRGDIVVFFSPRDGTRMVKRVIGLPGDTVEMRNEQLVLNGQPIAYAPLDAGVSSQLSEADRQRSLFASEQLPSRPHAVMVIPGVHATRSFGPVEVPAGHYFMLGDNRDDSFDSRFYGPVPREKIVGRAPAVALSFNRNDKWQPRWGRFFSALD